MTRRVVVSLALAATAFGPVRVHAQDSIPWPAGDRLQASVLARVDRLGAALFRMTYTVSTDPASEQSGESFVVRTPVPATGVTAPALWMGVATMVVDSSAVHWYPIASQQMLAPGAVRAGFSFVATGLPEIVAYRLAGHAEPPEVEEGVPVASAPSLWADAAAGLTVGVGPLPSDVTPASLLDRLSALSTRACGLGWIADQGICSRLVGNLDQARQELTQGNNAGGRAQLQDFLATLEDQHGLAVNDNAYWLLKVNAEFVLNHIPGGGTARALFLVGSGGTANPPTLSLSAQAPTGTTAKYKDSPGINYSGGNPWAEVGTWAAAPALVSGTLTALGESRVWFGLKNSDDQGTYFDVRAEVFKDGTLLASGETRCVQGITRNPANAKEVILTFGPVSAAAFNGTTDVLSLKVLTRIGTTATGARCGGHSNAVGLRLYFDAVSRAAQVTATF